MENSIQDQVQHFQSPVYHRAFCDVEMPGSVPHSPSAANPKQEHGDAFTWVDVGARTPYSESVRRAIQSLDEVKEGGLPVFDQRLIKKVVKCQGTCSTMTELSEDGAVLPSTTLKQTVESKIMAHYTMKMNCMRRASALQKCQRYSKSHP